MNATWLYKHVKNHEKSIPVGNDNNFGVPLHKCSCCKMTFYTKEDSLIHQQTNHADILSKVKLFNKFTSFNFTPFQHVKTVKSYLLIATHYVHIKKYFIRVCVGKPIYMCVKNVANISNKNQNLKFMRKETVTKARIMNAQFVKNSSQVYTAETTT